MSGYPGIDISQLIFGGTMIIVLIFFAAWGITVSRRMSKMEKDMRDFRELEPEGYEEEEGLDTMSEAARLKADSEAARQRDIVKQARHAEQQKANGA